MSTFQVSFLENTVISITNGIKLIKQRDPICALINIDIFLKVSNWLQGSAGRLGGTIGCYRPKH